MKIGLVAINMCCLMPFHPSNTYTIEEHAIRRHLTIATPCP